MVLGCSGGADSLALAAAVAFECGHQAARASVGASARNLRPVLVVVVDHGLHPDSAEVAATAATTCRDLGLPDVLVVPVTVPLGPGTGGLEAAARTQRHRVLTEQAARFGAAAVLLAHTRDDQAETVLLRLARGSGARSLAGMAAVSGHLRRPLLGLTRAQTVQACRALGLCVWSDPANADPRFLRSRVRHELLPALEAQLGPGVAAALARTAAQLRADADALDALAAAALGAALVHGATHLELLRAPVLALPSALRDRVLLGFARALGSPPGALGAVHVAALSDLLLDHRGRGPIWLPGGVAVHRRDDRLSAVTVGTGGR